MPKRRPEIPEDRQRQFDHLKHATERLFEWCIRENVRLHRVEPCVPFVETDFSAHIVFFLKADEDVRAAAVGGTRDLQDVFRDALREAGCPDEQLAQLTFEVDSDERVQREFEGSYFYRMR